ncbi:aminotransferase class V-fold PLP-dependent enzyme [Corynebacterium doosanense]|uniref:Cysteine desulfurase n=1 Tax=Corynebacterium doosanense CAU 212 = DSM 45436 TaxID=558173 RepID=A0A097ID56_9CORY|nr:aminotransferase class V-fold PLP-dependent enzyme [Corynebacterium doosanense]AIT60068.1 cysteine desulfurase [Corynebacterium doosanense CAU 212 = DSM 45436]
MSGYDVFSVRGLYTSLGDGWTYLNAHSCPQIPERVSSAVARSFRLSTAVSPVEKGGSHAQQRAAGTPEGDGFAHQARVAVADLVGATADSVVLGPSMAVLYSQLARAMRPMWRRGSSVVLSGLDGPEFTAPFAEGPASEIRWAVPDLGTGQLPGFQFRDLVDGSTRLVSFSATQGEIGSVADIEQITEDVRSRSRAWVLVDASSLAPSRPLDIHDLNVDILGVDLAQLGGPQVSALVFRDPLMFNRLGDVVPGIDLRASSVVSAGLAGGVAPTIDHLAALTDSTGTRRQQLVQSMTALSGYMRSLRDDLYLYLDSLESVHIVGVTGEAAAGAGKDRLPRLSFAVNGVPAETVQRRLVDNGLVTALAPASSLMEEMGVADIGGAVTVGLGPFNTTHDVNQLIRAVASLA